MKFLGVFRFITTLWIRQETKEKITSKSINKVVKYLQKWYSIEKSKEHTLWKLRPETVHRQPDRTTTTNQIQVRFLFIFAIYFN